MVPQFATVLALPLRQQNMMLILAGFAPLYSEHDLSDPELAPIHRAIAPCLQILSYSQPNAVTGTGN
jgi:hypothetical protein